MAEAPHLSWPLRLAGSRLATVDQDSPDEISQRVWALMRTPRGWREEYPDMGVNTLFRDGGADLVEIARQLDSYIGPEGTIDATVEQDPESIQDALAEVGIELVL